MQLSSQDEWRRVVRRAGLRATQHRLEVLRLLGEARAAVTHAELHEAFAPGVVDRTTVFRNLLTLVRVGLVDRLTEGDRLWRYALAGRDFRERTIFECVKCARRTPLPAARISFSSPDLPAVVKERRFQLRLHGVCDFM